MARAGAIPFDFNDLGAGTVRAGIRPVLSSTACRPQLDFVKILGDLVRDHGKTFRGLAKFQDAPECHHERVYTAADFEVWLLSWLPGQITPIHDHAGAVTVTTVLSGSLIEERFVRTSGLEVRPVWTMPRVAGDLDPIDATAIHRVRPIGKAVTLHLYVPSCREGQIYQAVA